MAEAKLNEFIGVCTDKGDWNDEWKSAYVGIDGTDYSIKDRGAYEMLQVGAKFAIGWRTTTIKSTGGPGRPRIENVSPAGGSSAAQTTGGGAAPTSDGLLAVAAKQRSIELQQLTEFFTPHYLMTSGGVNIKALASDVVEYWNTVFTGKADADGFVNAVKAKFDATEDDSADTDRFDQDFSR